MNQSNRVSVKGVTSLFYLTIFFLGISSVLRIFFSDKAIECKSEIIMTEPGREFSSNLLSKETIVLVTDIYPPYIYDYTSEEQGFFVEVILAAFEAVGLKVEIQRMPWARCEDMVDSGHVWGAFPYVKNEERDKKYRYSASIYDSYRQETVLYYRNELETLKGMTIDDISDLKGYRFGGTEGYWYLSYLDENDIYPFMNSNEKDLFQQLSDGKLDILPGDRNIGKHIIESNDRILEENIGILDFSWPETYESYYIMLDKDNPEFEWFNDRFEEGMAAILENGTYESLQKEFEKSLE